MFSLRRDRQCITCGTYQPTIKVSLRSRQAIQFEVRNRRIQLNHFYDQRYFSFLHKRHEVCRLLYQGERTLAHPRGRQIFRRYLEQRSLTDNLECLNLYESCSDLIEKEHNISTKDLNLERLTNDVTEVKELIEDLDGVPQIDLAFLERFNEALNSECRITMLSILEDTKERLRDHLRRVHGSFKRYASEPCPMTK
ncbi:hypothetical protein KPH14_003319 [Odynerus spinipes]|uniref:Uncharacterized protein n=1 Tax=Odynerus spinipes TaxID=1348599 RepID=A0AAD9RCH0_9HYME|nr:hypothetical protein KPH14_003319 [Odynerus spinipes]